MSNARKSLVRTALLAFVGLGMMGAEAEAQTFLRNRDFLNLGHPEPYLNYGRKEYDPYPSVINARNRYDRLGNYLSRGFNVFTWEFSRPGESNINTRTAQYLGWFANLVMLNDSYKGWNYRVTLGEDIRAKFSDLTFSDPRFYGILLDGASSDNKFTLMLSQGGDLLSAAKFSTFKATRETSPVLIFGGHWETKLGNVLRMGATYFNQHMANTADENGSFLKGDTPYSMLPPSFIEVIVEDDSPDEIGRAATVYDVDVVIIGESQGQRVRLTSIEGDPEYDSSLKMIDPVGGAEGGLTVAGSDQVIFRFQMPQFNLPDDAAYSTDPEGFVPGLTMKSVRFLADVEGDYRILVRQQHLFFDQRAHQRNVDKVADGDDRYAPGGGSHVNPFTGLKGDDAIKPLEDVLVENPDAFNQWPVVPGSGHYSGPAVFAIQVGSARSDPGRLYGPARRRQRLRPQGSRVRLRHPHRSGALRVGLGLKPQRAKSKGRIGRQSPVLPLPGGQQCRQALWQADSRLFPHGPKGSRSDRDWRRNFQPRSGLQRQLRQRPRRRSLLQRQLLRVSTDAGNVRHDR